MIAERLEVLENELLSSHKSIRWVGITNEDGVQLSEKYREGLKPFLTKEENEDYASHTMDRHRKRLKFQPKLGKLEYALVKYESVNRAIIPINDKYYLLIAIDIGENDVDRIIMEEIIPLARERQIQFSNEI
ncbi:MAG TPA: hypothetical protein VE130_00755 [Nitrososphaeraceae archaeon]|jgi:hypothetical protein|nr:hypothetical protein [Nitrososphaeraceae archaeon]